jgi:ABC-type Zn uptake system ZnuABC Zn-binding protein ZnuA
MKRWALSLAGAVALIAGTIGIVRFRTDKVPLRPETGKPHFAATIFPLYDIARNIAGEGGVVTLIVPPGASPHFFEFSPRQLSALQDVKTVFSIGHGLDDWVAQATTAAGTAQVTIVDHGIALRRFEDGTTDPHYWLRLDNAGKIAANIAAILAANDTAHAETYRANARDYQRKLAAEERELKDALAPARGSPILTFHDAWFYFADEFGLKIAGTFEPASGQEPTARYLANLQRRIKADHIRAIFIEPQLSSGVLRSFARDNGVEIAELDPLGGTEGRATYLDLMAFNVHAVRKAIEGLDP